MISITRIKPIKNINILNIPTIKGDCNWNPQPTLDPDDFKAINTVAIRRKETKTPKENIIECALILNVESPPSEIKLSTFKEIIGNTQGIKFKIRPPINAKINACIIVIVCFESLSTDISESTK